MVASEALPFAKTGGLADVIGSLPRALVRLGHTVDVVMPRYRGITAGARSGDSTVHLGRQRVPAAFFTHVVDGVTFVFVHHDEGRFEPREVVVGVEGDGQIEVLSGLIPGERVVTAANFLIDSESRFRAAVAAYGSGRAVDHAPEAADGPHSDPRHEAEIGRDHAAGGGRRHESDS